ncbi:MULTISPECIES: methionyl-tRNA formyltransferase [Clostridium]|jgi:methionyl-tRNA formyltransferase (EC 2.1.2.9)|uniref:Methionyl-tRNA formyltransferase n=2 Tax=Clostridium beijerinckii TaxID=1520 RepID=FMT_CLOB8|nr:MULTISPECIES: methionyl-tRNA formyltransferase [Clostridium]A6LSJ8.1 RecName: Full=Methionyl-tRNA formyltransferase [Clostridium beijerinckii NCIMB 8052]ABR33328.1 methionyl-tRNA formyltransferase [Clostridium beijerinckii NCIMB 8052]AIU00271.1 methionyl-tRNA formyltransferase [Clostridium beijerinckii ATCC 35702]ALB47523.1 methionyl-tRNA formyltransferase [Clostridium beijerinckii NRRL B-598]MBF7811775.1 methionyl-tRNA formyltransferase [Clostridium beijerinckii]MCI1478285.1 methionyl-tRN
MNIVFMGTPDFAVPSLQRMIKEYNVTAILTQPDKPKGRGKKMAYSAVKEEGLKHEIPIYQPIKLKDDRDLIEKLKELKPDFIIVVAFGQILTKEVLDIPKYGCINLHASLLPMYRGAAPLNWAIINGEKSSGNTTMLMDVGLDTGDMILKDEVEITNNMTTGELHDILMVRGADLLVKSIEGISKGDIVPEKQGNETFYAKMLDKNIANIDWNKSAEEIHNLVRGLNPWPIAYTDYKNERMKIYETEVLKEKSNKEPGTIIDVSKNGVKVSCKEDVLLIKRVQFPNGKPLTIEQYINGHEIEENIILQ